MDVQVFLWRVGLESFSCVPGSCREVAWQLYFHFFFFWGISILISTVAKIIYTPTSNEEGSLFPCDSHRIHLFSLLWSQGGSHFQSLLAEDAEHPEGASEGSLFRCYRVPFSHQPSASKYTSLLFSHLPCCVECCDYCSLSRTATHALLSFGKLFFGYT